MANSERGHAKNIANFERQTDSCTGFGATYNPTKNTIKLAAMLIILTNARSAMASVGTLLAAKTNAKNARKALFNVFDSIVTRATNALKASDVTKETIETGKSFSRTLKGQRRKAKLTEIEKQKLEAAGKSTTEISSAHTSMDNLIENFEKFIKFLSTTPSYNPNETELKVTTLTTYLNDLKAKNSAFMNADVALANARISRNEILYKANTGLVHVAIDSKTYIKSVYGASSPQYKQVSKLVYKDIKG